MALSGALAIQRVDIEYSFLNSFINWLMATIIIGYPVYCLVYLFRHREILDTDDQRKKIQAMI